MKIYTQTLALALALTAASNTLTAVSAASCADNCVGCTDKLVTGGETFDITAPANTCPAGDFAYAATLQYGVVSPTLSADAPLTFSYVGSDTVLNPTGDTNICETEYMNVGKRSVAAHAQATITCGLTAPATCDTKYKVTWGCKQHSCADQCTVDCTPDNVPDDTPLVITRPGSDPVCDTFAYVSSMTVGATDGSTISVTFAHGATNIPATKVNACSSEFVDVGKDVTLAGHVSPTVSCDSNTGCDITYKVTWTCVPAPTPAPTTVAPTPEPTTVAPTPEPTTVAPTPEPTTVAPTPEPTTVAPTPEPTTVAPTPEPTTVAPTPEPTTVAPTPEPTTVAPTPAPTPAATPPASGSGGSMASSGGSGGSMASSGGSMASSSGSRGSTSSMGSHGSAGSHGGPVVTPNPTTPAPTTPAPTTPAPTTPAPTTPAPTPSATGTTITTKTESGISTLASVSPFVWLGTAVAVLFAGLNLAGAQ